MHVTFEHRHNDVGDLIRFMQFLEKDMFIILSPGTGTSDILSSLHNCYSDYDLN